MARVVAAAAAGDTVRVELEYDDVTGAVTGVLVIDTNARSLRCTVTLRNADKTILLRVPSRTGTRTITPVNRFMIEDEDGHWVPPIEIELNVPYGAAA